MIRLFPNPGQGRHKKHHTRGYGLPSPYIVYHCASIMILFRRGLRNPILGRGCFGIPPPLNGSANPPLPNVRDISLISHVIVLFFCAMTQYIKEKHSVPRVSVERVASGSGLVNVYEFLCLKYPERVDKVVDAGESFFPRTWNHYHCIGAPQV